MIPASGTNRIAVGECRETRCRAPLFWLLTAKGSRMPIDAGSARCGACLHPHAEGEGVRNLAMPCDVVIIETHSGEPYNRLCGCATFVHQPIYSPSFHVAHWGTCKVPRKFKRPSPPAREDRG